MPYKVNSSARFSVGPPAQQDPNIPSYQELPNYTKFPSYNGPSVGVSDLERVNRLILKQIWNRPTIPNNTIQPLPHYNAPQGAIVTARLIENAKRRIKVAKVENLPLGLIEFIERHGSLPYGVKLSTKEALNLSKFIDPQGQPYPRDREGNLLRVFKRHGMIVTQVVNPNSGYVLSEAVQTPDEHLERELDRRRLAGEDEDTNPDEDPSYVEAFEEPEGSEPELTESDYRNLWDLIQRADPNSGIAEDDYQTIRRIYGDLGLIPTTRSIQNWLRNNLNHLGDPLPESPPLAMPSQAMTIADLLGPSSQEQQARWASPVGARTRSRYQGRGFGGCDCCKGGRCPKSKGGCLACQVPATLKSRMIQAFRK